MLSANPLRAPSALGASPPQASVEETNRVRALLGMAPLKGTRAPPAAAAPSVPAAADGPIMGPTPLSAAQAQAHAAGATSAAPGTAPGSSQPSRTSDPSKGPEAVLATTLDRYTDARPVWR